VRYGWVNPESELAFVPGQQPKPISIDQSLLL
ncbi:MAG: hypothetical protein ACI845_004025, partial [Gammaproteobacteria bacterium]